MQVTSRNLVPPIRQGDQGFCIQLVQGLTTAIFNDGLEMIEDWAFKGCALVRIDIPPLVRAIMLGAFKDCLGLTTAILNDGLEEIGDRAFYGCALVRIDIPPSVRAIQDWAYFNCSG